MAVRASRANTDLIAKAIKSPGKPAVNFTINLDLKKKKNTNIVKKKGMPLSEVTLLH